MIGEQKLVDEVAAAALDQFASHNLRAEELAISFINMRGTGQLEPVNYRGAEPIYPASVIKLFYLVAAHKQLEDGQIEDTPELRRAFHEMIVHSGNDATSYVMDVLTNTTSGPELSPAKLADWLDKRDVVNRYFHSHGYPEINANRKTWNEGAFGRDRQAVESPNGSRNSLTTNATARLLKAIATGKCISPLRSAQMMELLKRDLRDPQRTDHQAFEFIGAALPETAQLWSKAGYMSQARHDAAVVELIDGTKFILVIFTTRPSVKEIIPEIARRILSGITLK